MLIATTDQLTAALALIELDGIARSVVPLSRRFAVGPFAFRHRFGVRGCNCHRSDRAGGIPSHVCFVTCSPKIVPRCLAIGTLRRETEWILLTSGTTGRPKLVVHTLSSLAGAIESSDARQAGRLEHLLRYSPLWRTSDISAGGPYRRIAGAVERRRVHGGFSGSGRRTASDPYLRNALSLAASAHEPVGAPDCAPDTFACREKSRTRRSWTISGPFTRRPSRPRFRLDGGWRRIRGQRWSRGISCEPHRTHR